MTAPTPRLVNTFTDANPSFPYQSSEARRHLGIPDAPAIHLAITDLAERLLAVPRNSNDSEEVDRMTALRCSSYGVLMNHPFEYVLFSFQAHLNLPGDQEASEKAYNAGQPDWLGQAIARLKGEGFASTDRVRRMATRYGWDPAA